MKTFVQYGAGNIGRGFIGALFSQAGYAVRFVDVDETMIRALNERKSYDVEIVSKKGNSRTTVQNVSGIDGRQPALVARAIAKADLMATAVGVNILPKIVPNIVEGLRLRWNSGNREPLNIIICENLIDADKLLYKLIAEKLDSGEKALLDSTVGLVEASIGRMVPVMPGELRKKDCLFVRVEKYGKLPIDRSAFKGEIPKIADLYPFSPFEFFIRRKLYIHNMGHALTAYCGAIEGFDTIWRASEDPFIKLMAQRAMAESARALSQNYQVPLEGILEYIDDLLLRFENTELGDTVARVGRDTRRKLSASDRLAGAAKLDESLGILPVYTCAGIAAGLLFENDDEGTKSVREMLAAEGLDAVLTGLCRLEPRSRAAEYVRAYYGLLRTGADVGKLFALCEEFDEELLACRNIV